MALFSNISEFKQHVGGAVNVSLELDSIEPTMLDAARKAVELAGEVAK